MLVALVALISVTPAGADATSGTFVSSDPGINAIWAGSVKTATDMLVSGPITVDSEGKPCAIDVATPIIDGIPRDGCPYVGDESVIDRTLDASTPRWPVQRAMLVWFANHQHGDGSIPASPIYNGALDLVDYNAYWVQTLHDYVLYSGDVGLAKQVWPQLTRLFDVFYVAHTQNNLLVNTIGVDDYGYIRRHGKVVAYYNAQYVLALKDAAQLAQWVGDNDAATRWTARAKATTKAFSGAFWDASVGAFADTTTDKTTHPQDGNSFAILSGIATQEQATAALNYLVGKNWRDYGNTISDSNTWDGPDWGYQAKDRVYPFISYDELVARFQMNLDSSAFDLLRREWGYMRRTGPGTDWETIGPYGGPPTDQHPSFDSGWSSGAAAALSQFVLGVTPTSPGFATFTVHVHANDLKWAHGDVPTPHGPIHVSWKRLSNRRSALVKVTAPSGTRWVRF
ncbi:MAG TPA: alpha-L-rhamnosidase C-terminal domain-containing protein [Gaiellaceae bacterium]|nr:alpha-L-rhamnosidase C-terminal domain-containing protein [Gaiellaceae bacterium]